MTRGGEEAERQIAVSETQLSLKSGGETHLKVESNRITGLRRQAPEESVSLICPHQAVVLVMLDWGFWEGNVLIL